MKYEVIVVVRSRKVTSDFFSGNESIIATKKIEGESLQNIILNNRGKNIMEEKKIIKWARDVLEILDSLHGQPQPVIYGNISPGNIIISKEGTAHLKSLPFQKNPPGTAGYRPEEQDEGSTAEGSDIYALGAVMYYSVTGVEPSSYLFLPPTKHRQDLSPELEGIIMKALERKISARFASALEMDNSLVHFYLNKPRHTVVLGESPTSPPVPHSPEGQAFGRINSNSPAAGISSKSPAVRHTPHHGQKKITLQKPKKVKHHKKSSAGSIASTITKSKKDSQRNSTITLMLLGAFIITLVTLFPSINNYMTYCEGVKLREKGKYLEAMECFKDILKNEPDNEKFNMAMAENCENYAAILYEQGRYDMALTYFNNALTYNPCMQEALEGKKKILRLRGDGFFESGSYEAAVKDYNDLLYMEPANEKIIEKKKICLYQLGEKSFDRGEMGETLEYYKKIGEIDPEKGIDLLKQKGNLLFKKKDYRKAILFFEEALRISPEEKEIKKLEKTACYKIAEELFYYQNYQEAVPFYDKVLAIDPECREALKNKEIALKKIATEVAVEDEMLVYEKILKAQTGIIQDFAPLWDDKEKLSQALIGFEVKYNQYGGNLNLLGKDYAIQWGCGLIATDQYETAIMCYDSGLQAYPGTDDYIINKGMCYYFLKDYSQAMECYNGASEDNTRARLNKIITLYAMKQYTDVIQACPDLSKVYKGRETGLLKGDSFYRMRKYKEAVACYDKALYFSDNYINIYILKKKGQALENLGKPQEAQKCYSEVKDIGGK